MFHSVNFGDKNSWDDWRLIPSSRPFIAPPPVQTKFVEIPGMDGSYDMTDWLAGRPTYQNRSGAIEFVIADDSKSWATIYSEIMNYLHGKSMRLTLEDDPGYYYEGRFAVSQWKSDKWYSMISITYSLYPWKRVINSTGEEWEWDPFNFYTGVIQSFNAYPIDGTETILIYGTPYRESPKFTSTAAMTVEFNGNTYELPEGETTIDDIILEEGPNTLTFTGTGVIGIDYRGGSL